MTTEDNQASSENIGSEVPEFGTEDLVSIFHYPSIGHLFSDATSTALADFTSRMVAARDQLEKLVRHGSRQDADQAGIVIKGINVTLDFISSLERMRAGEN
jgi:hypothetical protein